MSRQRDLEGRVAVIGGGMAGLVAALTAAREGAKVTLYEAAASVGGRAVSENDADYVFNMGPHAFYCAGHGLAGLKALGIEVTGGMPELIGRSAVYRGKRYGLPLDLKTILTSGYLGLADKWQLLSFFKNLGSVVDSDFRYLTFADFIQTQGVRPRVQKYLEAMARLATYGNAPDQISGEVALYQMKLGLAGVLYADGGWQKMVDQLFVACEQAGVEVKTSASVSKVEGEGPFAVTVGKKKPEAFDAVVAAVTPSVAAKLFVGRYGLEDKVKGAIAVRAACLDVALTDASLVKEDFALGMDEPLYYSLHSKAAKLAPEGGALIQAAVYRPVEESAADKAGYQARLETLVEQMAPGYKAVAHKERYMKSATVYQWLPTAKTGGFEGRPAVEQGAGAYLAGDWVGREGLLVDAAIASGAKAGALAAAHAATKAEPLKKAG